MLAPRPKTGDHAPAYSSYVALVPDGEILRTLEQQSRETAELLRRVDEQRSLHRYAEGKWSIREVIGHVSDAERVWCYRALTFARADATPLPGFDENLWAAASNAHSRPFPQIVQELAAVRVATLALFGGFSDAEWSRSGSANNNHITVPALAWVIAGHERHHVKILRERYGLR
jgi:hypothetical protein